MGNGDAVNQISKGHASMSALLSARGKNLQIIRAMWSSGNIRVGFSFYAYTVLEPNMISCISIMCSVSEVGNCEVAKSELRTDIFV